jgi:acetylornithine/succinyldiaminopimelate/putrescine aminotransferase
MIKELFRFILWSWSNFYWTHNLLRSQDKRPIGQTEFYSNAILNPLQVELAEKLGKLSGCNDYSLFLCSSGAEANENALKMASFNTKKS